MRTAKMIIPKEQRVRVDTHQNHTPVNNDSIEGMTPEKDHPVKGSFTNIECPGQPAKISCRYYKGMQPFSKTFEDGEKATIPLSVARHINERCYYEEHSYLLDDEGNPLKTGKTKPRYKFIPEGYAA